MNFQLRNHTVWALAIAALVVTLLTATSAQAAIVVVNMYTGDRLIPQTQHDFDPPDPPGDTVDGTPYTISFNAGATADKLIVTLGSEKSAGTPVITYNGVGLSLIPNTSDGRNNGIWYLDNPYTGGSANLTFDMTAANVVNGIGFSVLSVSGTAPGYAANTVASGDSTSVTITTTAADSLVVTNYAANGGNNVTPPAGHTVLYGDGDIGSARGASSYINSVAAGPQTYTYTGGVPGSNDPRTSAAAFVVPAPAALPAGLALLGLVALRRRS